jgi:hypothetical protein
MIKQKERNLARFVALRILPFFIVFACIIGWNWNSLNFFHILLIGIATKIVFHFQKDYLRKPKNLLSYGKWAGMLSLRQFLQKSLPDAQLGLEGMK